MDRPRSHLYRAAQEAFANTSLTAVVPALRRGFRVPEMSYESVVATRPQLERYFDVDAADQTLAQIGLSPQGFGNFLLQPNGSEIFLALLEGKPSYLVNDLGEAFRWGVDKQQIWTIQKQAEGLSGGNIPFFGFALLAVGYGVAVGYDRLDDITHDNLGMADRPFNNYQAAIFADVGEFLLEHNITTPARNPEEVYARLLLAYPISGESGFYHYLLRFNQLAFGARRDDPNAGCPVVGFNETMFRGIGMVLRQKTIRDISLLQIRSTFPNMH